MLLGRSAMCNEVWKRQQSVRWKSWKKVSEVRTPHRMLGYGRFSILPFFASLAAALSYSSISPRTSRDSGYVLALCLCFRFRVSLLALPCFHHCFLPLWRRDNETASATTALGMINLHKCTQIFVNRIFLTAFLNGTDVCAQATPLLAFLKRDKLHS